MNGHEPFTSWRKFFALGVVMDEAREQWDMFWDAFYELRAQRHGGHYYRGQLAALVRGVEQLVQKERAS